MIDQQLIESAQVERHKVKLLLLGAGESGKSTIFKQMQLLYGTGFAQEDLVEMIPVIHSGMIATVKTLLEGVDQFGLRGTFSAPQVDAAEAFKMIDEDSLIAASDKEHMKTLWASTTVQAAWDRRAQLQVIEANGAYLDKIDEIVDPGYVPSIKDYLHTRVRTTGIVERQYAIEGVDFLIVDVGGQRNERKKWIHCFDQVSAVIFVAAISEFDQVLFEDYSQNRMVEALTLFEEVCRIDVFQGKPILLFLNKSDLFREKIQRVNIRDVADFSDYAGPDHDANAGIQFFLHKFAEKDHVRHHNGVRDIYHHVTTATDTSNIEFVLNACTDIILGRNLEINGF